MKFGFEEAQARYLSGTQRARVWTETWAANSLYCPNCGHQQLEQFPPNQPVADLYCSTCLSQFELKSQKRPFGNKVADGAFEKKIERLQADDSPNLILLTYDLDTASVQSVSIVPSHFFVPAIIQKRKPLADTARRAGWVGSNILLDKIPDTGRIYLIKNQILVPKHEVLEKWRKSLFLRRKGLQARGWLMEVMKCVEMLPMEFEIHQIYKFEQHLREIYPENKFVREKIRQQLQVLRDNGMLEFLSKGRYRRIID